MVAKKTSPRKAKGTEKPVSPFLKLQIIQIVREEIQAALEEQAFPTSQKELPPSPGEKVLRKQEDPKKKPRFVNPGRRVKIASTVDGELARLFTDWRNKKGLNLAKGLDAALWHFLGKPKLSFEE